MTSRLSHAAPRLAQTTRRLAVPVKLTDPFYESPEWRALASAVKALRNWRCEECGRDCSANRRTLHVDHVVERKDGGADLDPLNVRALCVGCHNRKTAGARVRRASVAGG